MDGERSMRGRDARFVAAIAAAWTVFAAIVYVPDVGRGFVKDDFRWVEAGRAALADPLSTFVRARSDFYRPVVELSFAADYAAYGVQPRGYGFTNLALYVFTAAAIWTLCRRLSLTAPAAAIAALAWAANPHGINMAVVWISGRTSLCLTLFALLSAIALQRRRYGWLTLFIAAALGSKEEAVVLPIVLFAWHQLVRDDGEVPHATDPRRLLASLAAPLAGYAALRLYAGAMTPGSAPPYYQLTFAPGLVARNLAEYADRGATIALVAAALAAVVWRARPAFDARQRRLLAAGAVWFAGGYAITVFVPIRSSLYAVFPSAGAAIACGVVVDAIRARAGQRHVPIGRLAAAAIAVLAMAVPIYRARNGRYVEPARMSERALRTIAPHATSTPQAAIVLHDVDDPTSNFVGAFGTFATSALRMRAGGDVTVWIDPPPGDWARAGLRPPRRDQPTLDFAVERGRIFRVGP